MFNVPFHYTVNNTKLKKMDLKMNEMKINRERSPSKYNILLFSLYMNQGIYQKNRFRMRIQ